MIDVWGVVRNGLWVIGLSVLLAVWSWARYAASQAGVKTKVKLDEPRFAVALDGGLVLFVAGMAATEERWWARLIWIVMGIVVFIHAVQTLRRDQASAAQDE